MKIESSELIINSDNSVFHLHIRPEELADNVILVGDPSRVDMVASFFEKCEVKKSSREFFTVTGYFRSERFTVLSTGIGRLHGRRSPAHCGHPACHTRSHNRVHLSQGAGKEKKRSLKILRIGTCGALQPDIKLGTPLFSHISIGFDGLLNWYSGRENVVMAEAEESFKRHMRWNAHLPDPYFVKADEQMASLFEEDTIAGMTISAAGFYGPQGRILRMGIAMPDMLDLCESFRYKDYRINNFEMEGAALAGLSRHLGHRAATICCVIANRYNHDALPDYKSKVKEVVELALDRLSLMV